MIEIVIAKYFFIGCYELELFFLDSYRQWRFTGTGYLKGCNLRPIYKSMAEVLVAKESVSTPIL